MGITYKKVLNQTALKATGAAFLLLFAYLPLVPQVQVPQKLLPQTKITFTNSQNKKITVQCETAANESSRNKGLMFRKSLPKNGCMLFVFEREQTLYFWMKNTSIPLSIAFINQQGVIVSIKDMTPLSLHSVSSQQPAIYAVEANQGWFQTKAIRTKGKVVIGSH